MGHKVTVTLTPELMAYVKQRAVSEERSVSNMILHLIKDCMQQEKQSTQQAKSSKTN